MRSEGNLIHLEKPHQAVLMHTSSCLSPMLTVPLQTLEPHTAGSQEKKYVTLARRTEHTVPAPLE